MHGQGFNPLILVAAFNVLAIFAAAYLGLRALKK
jgi:hypothetical protein